MLELIVRFYFLLTMANEKQQSTETTMPRILCLHGMGQSGAIFSNKIGGARRKLARKYDLHFLDGPIVLESGDGGPNTHAWWTRDSSGRHVRIQDTFQYIVDQTCGQSYDAILGFSQGGLLATGLALSGVVPGNIKAVVTAGAPLVDDVLEYASTLCPKEEWENALQIPKLHMAGETDAMIPVESTKALAKAGGSGEVIVHEQGHLFPTRAVRVNYMMDFLDRHLG